MHANETLATSKIPCSSGPPSSAACPWSQQQSGRDHNGGTFISFLAGAGLKPGIAHGQSDEWAWKAIDPIYCYDLHATILHLLGIDHEKLIFRHQGIDRRLTDVHGHVLTEILA